MSAALKQNFQIQLKLTVVKGPHAGQVFSLNQEALTIGRGPENDIVLINDPQISRSHAQIVLNEREFEIVKLSQKNAILVNGESIDRWTLLNQSTFVIGDSEIKFEYDLGQVVVSLQPKPVHKPTIVPVHATPKAAVSRTDATVVAKPQNAAPAVRLASVQKPLPPQMKTGVVSRPTNAFQAAPAVAPVQSASLLDHPKFKFYALVAILAVGFAIFMLGPTAKKNSTKLKPTLKYEDEVEIKLNSSTEKELTEKRIEKKQDRNSPQALRAQENFIKGMRDFSLGNYARAQDFFQVVLNLQPDHALARRHLYLSKIRFDEIVQDKLMLGESYNNKHNFSMCSSMYKQVMDMLDDRQADPKWKLAKAKKDECDLAQEGIR